MRKLNNKGFTLVELLAVIVVLAIVVGIGSYSSVVVMKNSKKKEYDLLVESIETSVQLYYQECNYVSDDCTSRMTLGYLVDNDYLEGNGTDNDYDLTNPLDDKDIRDCEVEYKNKDGEIVVEAVTRSGSCPTDY